MSESLQLDLLLKELYTAGMYIWLSCGVVLFLGLPIGLILLNRRGRRLAEENRSRKDG